MSLLSGPGATFGEVALLKEDDCLRTASILASDSTVDLIEIDRNLYNRCVNECLYIYTRSLRRFGSVYGAHSLKTFYIIMLCMYEYRINVN